jgi:ribosomal protein L37AE/L43A
MKVLFSRPTPFLRGPLLQKNIPSTGKRLRPKTAVKGKRYLCAKCRKRSPKPVKTPAPWYCPKCLVELAEPTAAFR